MSSETSKKVSATSMEMAKTPWKHGRLYCMAFPDLKMLYGRPVAFPRCFVPVSAFPGILSTGTWSN
jgi:hypothetical protein